MFRIFLENSWVTAPLPPNPDAPEEDSETTTLPHDDGERCQVSYQDTLSSVIKQVYLNLFIMKLLTLLNLTVSESQRKL